MLGRKGHPLRQLILGNRAALGFLIPKLLFIILVLGLVLLASNWLWVAALVTIGLEAGLALGEWRRLTNEGARRGRPLRCVSCRLTLSLTWVLVALALFNFAPLWLALPLVIFWLAIGLMGLALLNVWLLVLDMRAKSPSETAQLFQQVREMRDLDNLTGQLEAAILAAKDKNAQRDALFYLGWAETFRGHEAVGRGEWSADEFYQLALKADPANLAARTCLAIVQARHGDFELALNETRKAIQIFNGEIKHDLVVWNMHQNETGSEYEQNAGLFQLCALLIGILRVSRESGTAKQLLEKELIQLSEKLPNRSATDLQNLLQKKAGGHLGALGVLTAGPYRSPASPLDLLRPALTLPRSDENARKESAA